MILIQPVNIFIYQNGNFSSSIIPPPPVSPTYDVGSSISGGTFTEGGWKPAAIKWSRERHSAFLEATREEGRANRAKDVGLSELEKAIRAVAEARADHNAAEEFVSRSFTKDSFDKAKAAKEHMDAAEAHLAELQSIQYIEKLWADYRAKKEKRGRN